MQTGLIPVKTQQAVFRLLAVALLIALPNRLFSDQPPPSPVRQNPMRGLYEWFHGNTAPLPNPPAESYIRYTWKQLEPQRDQYDFTVIDQDIAKAHAKGQRFAFRVMSAWSGQGAVVPDYLVASLKNGVWFNGRDASAPPTTYFPDWNDPLFLDRARRLVTALGKRYDGNPSIAWVDIGTYGNFGEWHTFPYKYPSPQGAVAGTGETKRAVVDMYADAFPTTRLIMMTDDTEGVLYAMSKSPKIGLRRDSLGDPWFEKGLTQDPSKWAAIRDRWKTAPFVAELFYAGDTPDKLQSLAGLLQTARRQARQYHVSLVGNGNLPNWKKMPAEAQAALYALGDGTGYDLHPAVAATVIPSPSGRRIGIAATWTNTGSAPTYDAWTVTYLLVPASGNSRATATLGRSRIDLRSVLPAPDGTSAQIHEQFALPGGLAPGRYGVAVEITDPSGVRPAMMLDEAPSAPAPDIVATLDVT